MGLAKETQNNRFRTDNIAKFPFKKPQFIYSCPPIEEKKLCIFHHSDKLSHHAKSTTMFTKERRLSSTREGVCTGGNRVKDQRDMLSTQKKTFRS